MFSDVDFHVNFDFHITVNAIDKLWIWTRIAYHPSIRSDSTNQVH